MKGKLMDFVGEKTIGRVSIINGTPPQLPGKCVMCGSVSGTFVDFGFDLDFYGIIYFCKECFTEIANSLSYVSPDQWNNLENQVGQLTKELGQANREKEALKDALRNDFSALASLVGTSVATVSLLDEDTEPEPTRNEQGPVEDEQGPYEQSNEWGLTNLPDDDFNSHITGI